MSLISNQDILKSIIPFLDTETIARSRRVCRAFRGTTDGYINNKIKQIKKNPLITELFVPQFHRMTERALPELPQNLRNRCSSLFSSSAPLLIAMEAWLRNPRPAIRFIEDRNLMLAWAERFGNVMRDNPQFSNDREVVLTAVQNYGKALAHADPVLQEDPEILFAALTTNPEMLEDAPHKKWQNNRDFIFKLVSKNGLALKYADDSLKSDPKIAMAALKQNPGALEFTDPSLEFGNDPKRALAAAKRGCLKGSSHELRADPDVVLTAVTNNGLALADAHPRFKKDRKIVLAAVRQNGYAIEIADTSFLNDPELVAAAIKQNPGLIYLHPEPLDAKLTAAMLKTLFLSGPQNYPPIIELLNLRNEIARRNARTGIDWRAFATIGVAACVVALIISHTLRRAGNR